ncbi:hypothetical protein MRX96_055800 [Rhipicephalus microplus]
MAEPRSIYRSEEDRSPLRRLPHLREPSRQGPRPSAPSPKRSWERRKKREVYDPRLTRSIRLDRTAPAADRCRIDSQSDSRRLRRAGIPWAIHPARWQREPDDSGSEMTVVLDSTSVRGSRQACTEPWLRQSAAHKRPTLMSPSVGTGARQQPTP